MYKESKNENQFVICISNYKLIGSQYFFNSQLHSKCVPPRTEIPGIANDLNNNANDN